MDNTFHNAFSPIKNIKSVKQYEQEIDQLQNENFNLKSKIAFLSHSAPATQQSQELTNYINDTQLSYNILKDENKMLKEENEMLRNKLCDDESMNLKEENMKIVKCVENLNKQHNEEKERILNEKNMLVNEIHELKIKYENEAAKYVFEKQDLENRTKIEFTKLNEKNKAQEIEILNLMSELEKTKAYYNLEIQKRDEELKIKVELHEIEIKNYKNALEKAKIVEEQLKTAITKIDNENLTKTDNEKLVKMYNEKLKKIQDYANGIKQKNKEYVMQINEGNNKYDALQLECKQINDQKNAVEKELQKIKYQNEYSGKSKHIENDENYNENEYINYKKEITSLNDKIKEYKIKLIKCENETDYKNIEIEKQKNELEKYKLAYKEMQKENRALSEAKLTNNETESIKIINEELNDKIKKLEKSIEKLENERNDLQIYNEELQNKVKMQFVTIRSVESDVKNKEFLIKLLEEKNKKLEIREEQNIKNSFEVSNLYKSNKQDRIKLLESEILILRQNKSKLKHELEIEKICKQETNAQLQFFVTTIEKIRKNVERIKNKVKKNDKCNLVTVERYKQKIIDLQKKCKKESKKIIEPFSLISKKNQEFIKNNFTGINDLNEVIQKFILEYKKLNNKIDVLEKENSQISFFVENNNNKKIFELLEVFNQEFCNAKAELEYCKEYLKKKSSEIKQIQNMNKIYKNKIEQYEQKNKEEKNDVRYFGSKPNFATY